MGTRGPVKGMGGRPKKAVSEKIQTGNPGKRKLKVMQNDIKNDEKSFENDDEITTEIKDYLTEPQRNGEELRAKEIFLEVFRWLKDRECEKIVPPELIENYAITKARYIQCERILSAQGFLANKNKASPYVDIANSYLKQSTYIWNLIFQIVKENCVKDLSLEDDPMERLLSAEW